MNLDSIKSSHPVPALFERDGHVLKRAADHQVCLCPFHRERKASCHVWDDHFKCFGCNAWGDCFTYIEKTRSVTFKEALRILSNGHMPVTSFTRVEAPRKREELKSAVNFATLAAGWSSATSEDQMNALAEELGVSSEVLWWLGTGWGSIKVKDRDRAVWSFPMRNGVGRVVGIRLRAPDGFKFAVTGSHQGLFIAPELEPQKTLFIVEGPSDCAAALTLGFYAIGRPSCHGCIADVVQFIARNGVREAVIVADNDEPGINGAKILRAALKVPSRMLVLPPKDLRRFVQIGGGKALLQKMISNQQLLRP